MSRKKGRRVRRGGRKGRRTREMVHIAKERIDLLMDHSMKTVLAGDQSKANRYASLARRIGMRYNVRMSKYHRQLFCRNCKGVLLPFRTMTIRIRRGKRIIHCLACGDIKRYPILKKRA